jgi:hypothetical protein
VESHRDFAKVALSIFFPEFSAKAAKENKSFACAVCAHNGVRRFIVAGNGRTNL